jgi:hypothetical protein
MGIDEIVDRGVFLDRDAIVVKAQDKKTSC